MDPARTFIEKIQNMPSPSPVLQRINSAMSDEESSAFDIVEALKLDPAIVSRVLRLANSAYIGIPRTVSSLQNAVVLLGQKRIRALVMSASVLTSFRIGKFASFSLEDYWRHSTTVGMIAESIARHLRRYDTIVPDEVFAAAIMHDIGKLVLAGYDPVKMTESVSNAIRGKVPYYQAENGEFAHTRIGAQLAGRWLFPSDITGVIEFHHNPSAAELFSRQVSIVHVSDIMAHTVGFNLYRDEVAPRLDEKALEAVPLPLERLKVIAQDILDKEKELEALIGFFL